MGKRAIENNEDETAAAELAAKKAAKKAKKVAALVVEEAGEENLEAEARAAKKAAKKAKKAAGLAVPEAEAEEEDALAKKKAAKKAKKIAAAEVEAEEEDPEAALAAKKAAKKAKKAAALAAAEKEEETAPLAKKKKDEDPAPKKEESETTKPGEDEEWKDNTYKCIDCSADWVDTADDQEFRWSKGFAETPKRCKDCRWAKKVRMEGGDPTEKGKGKGKKGKDGGNENTVFVRGLPFATTEEALNKDFGECGEIVTCRMPLNDEGSCKGIAFIKFTDKESMDKAVAYNETDYGGRTIFVVPAADKPEGKGKDKGKDGKGKDGKGGKGKGKDGKGKGKKGKASSEAFAKTSGAMVESTGTKQTFADSDDD